MRLQYIILDLNALSANLTKWSNTIKQFVGNFQTNCLSVFGHFVGLALKGLRLHFPVFILPKLFPGFPLKMLLTLSFHKHVSVSVCTFCPSKIPSCV